MERKHGIELASSEQTQLKSPEPKSTKATKLTDHTHVKNKNFVSGIKEKVFFTSPDPTARTSHTPNVTFNIPEKLFHDVLQPSSPWRKDIQLSLSFPSNGTQFVGTVEGGIPKDLVEGIYRQCQSQYPS
jgi:hypothetical protein